VLIDDDEDLLLTYHALLEAEGYTVHTFARPFACPADIARLHPDVIVLNLLFCGEPGGWAMRAALRTDRKAAHVPVVICTAALRQPVAYPRELGVGAHTLAVVPKPFDIDAFLETIAAACRLRALQRV
jgi:DNA-binding NtrC family response regulator